jgi:1-deoxy-D-xylulose-5-phosphate synthase
VRPVNPQLAVLAADHALVVTVEDGVRDGGVGVSVARMLADAVVATPVCVLGLPTTFIPHGDRADLLAEHGLDGQGICVDVLRRLSRVGTTSRETPRRARTSVRGRLTPLPG